MMPSYNSPRRRNMLKENGRALERAAPFDSHKRTFPILYIQLDHMLHSASLHQSLIVL
jgi:hypothetical protein